MLIGGKYEVLRVLGEGGMGIVYEARQRDLHRGVAIKVLRGDAARDPEMVARFRREARVAASLTSPHVARILDFGTTDDGDPFMVLELLEGRDLQAEIDARGPLPLDEAIGIVLEACEGVREAHARGVTHRDLKPGNLFLAQQNGRRVVKILDFGISKVSGPENERVTVTKGSFGTPLYMSPEQIKSARLVDHRTDVWALGVILYEAITGEPPFVAESATALAVAIATEPYPPPSTRVPGLSAAVDALVARALTKDLAQRTQTVDELVRQLRGLDVADEPTAPADAGRSASLAALAETSRVTTSGATTTTPPRRTTAKVLAVALATTILLLTVALGVSSRWLPERDQPGPTASPPSSRELDAEAAPDAPPPPPPPAEPRVTAAEAPPTVAPVAAPPGTVASTATTRPPAPPTSTARPSATPPPPKNVDARGRPTFL